MSLDLQKYNDVPLDKGLFDGLHPADVPAGGFSEMLGFELEYGWPIEERGRLKKTSSEVRSGMPFREGVDWHRPSGSIYRLAVADGGIWKETTGDGFDYTTLISKIDVGASSASIDGTKKIVTVAGGKCLFSVRVGDYFFFNADGVVYRDEVDTIDGQTQFTLGMSYGGSATTGAFTIWRKLNDGTTSFAITSDGRIFFADGVGPLHWFGDDGTGSDIFRPAGMMRPATVPAFSKTASLGNLSAGDYFWQVAFADARGNVGPAITVPKRTVVADDRAQIGSGSTLPQPPPWAKTYEVYRPFVNGDTAYRIVRDVETQIKSIAADTPSPGYTRLTLNDDVPDLRDNAHRDRLLTFAAGNEYIVYINDTRTIDLYGDASAETATSVVKITGGFDVDKSLTNGDIRDYSADTDLDYDHPAPGEITGQNRSYNEPPPEGLQYVTIFDGGSRLVAYEEGTCSRAWFSGRPPVASKTGQADFGGRLEFDYWPHFQDVGPANGDEVQGFFELGNALFSAKLRSIWECDRSKKHNPAAWGWGPVAEAEHIGCVAPKSIVVHSGVAWWLGLASDEVDLIRFDSYNAIPFLRPRLKGTLDAIAYPSGATAAVFEGKLYVSVPVTGGENNRTVRLYLKGDQRVDEQPWGCGVFIKREGEDGTTLALRCGSPEGDESHIYEVLGSVADNEGNITRSLITGEISDDKPDREILWSHILVEVIVETP